MEWGNDKPTDTETTAFNDFYGVPTTGDGYLNGQLKPAGTVHGSVQDMYRDMSEGKLTAPASKGKAVTVQMNGTFT
eukprot:7391832-Prymnesium_polylepis.1